MLNWWLGVGRPTEGNRVEDQNPDQEPPETPAPVFAARALKSALFGTPARPDEDDTTEVNTKIGAMADKNTQKHSAPGISPTKPPGILLTPGTATARRKTVSFGTDICDKNDKNAGGERGPDGRRNSSVREQEGSYKVPRMTPLTRTLEQARETTARKNGPDTNRGSSGGLLVDLDSTRGIIENAATICQKTIKPSISTMSNQESLQGMIPGDNFDGDMTMDLNEPHSQSGQYWKSEYEQYHEQAKAEMQKLLKYKQLAKSYAQKKDAETIELTERLREEQRRVTGMEDRISKLSSQIGRTGSGRSDDESPEMIKELARQTALALQYKAQVEEFRLLLEGSTSPLAEEYTDTHRQSRSAREQLKEITLLREEMKDIRGELSIVKKDNSKLQVENSRLAQQLNHTELRLERQGEQSEKRRQVSEEQLQKKTEAYKSLQDDYNILKEKAKSQRGNAEHLLKARHDQVAALKKELASLQKAKVPAGGLQEAPLRKSLEVEQVIAGSRKQPIEIEQNLGGHPGRETNVVDNNSAHEQWRPKRVKYDSAAVSHQVTDTINARESLIPVSTKPIPAASNNGRQTQASILDMSPVPRVPHPALSEIVNNANTERVPLQKTSTAGYTPLAHRLSDMSLESPKIELPSPEPSLSHITGRTIHERTCHASPRPSMFNFGSSPPKPAITRPQAPNGLSRQRSTGTLSDRRQALLASSRLSSPEGSRTRSNLPPERVAAARARLAQKSERRAKAPSGVEKENAKN